MLIGTEDFKNSHHKTILNLFSDRSVVSLHRTWSEGGLKLWQEFPEQVQFPCNLHRKCKVCLFQLALGQQRALERLGFILILCCRCRISVSFVKDFYMVLVMGEVCYKYFN